MSEKVYVVTRGDYSDYHIITATTNKDIANQIAKKFDAKVEIYDNEGNQLFIAWKNNNDYVYTTYIENSEPTIGTNVYSDEYLNIVGTISAII